MANAHRTNVLVTSCLKTPVDPHTKAPVALYERERVLPYSADHMDNRDYEREIEYEDSGSEVEDEDCTGLGSPLATRDYGRMGESFDLRDIFFSNEEYYRKLEELKKAHLRTMAELESMYRKKLQLKGLTPLDTALQGVDRLPWVNNSPVPLHRLRKTQSAVELRVASGQSDTSDEECGPNKDTEKGLLSSPKEHIKNMWQGFKLSPYDHHQSSSSLQSLPGDHRTPRRKKGKSKKNQACKDAEQESWRHRVTVPKPFHMTLREAAKRQHGIKTRSEIELENAELRKQLEELTECQRKFRASPLPAHVRLPLYEELQERGEERRRALREREEQHLRTIQKPFSFLERERLKKEQREEQLRHLKPSDQETVKPFKAKPVPKSVYAAASGEQMKEEHLYRAIKMQMRAKELLSSASMPPSMMARRLSDRKKAKEAASESDDNTTHRPKINKDIPDFDASYRRFRKHLESRKEVKPVTACEPFQLRTSQIASHRQRILADIEKEQMSPRMNRWPYISQGLTRTPNSSLCSSLSGSLELLPAKATDAAKKRQEAVRKVLEQRKKAEEEEEKWKERQKQREKKLQKVVLKRAQANDPHQALSETCQSKLKEFRKQDLQRRKEYRQEIKEIQQRVKGRPLLLEQVAQRNAKQAAEKRYADALRDCGLSEDFISSRVAQALRPDSPGTTSLSTDSRLRKEEDPADTPVHYRKVFLDDDGYPDNDNDTQPDEEEKEGKHTSEKEEDDEDHLSSHEDDNIGRYSDDSDHHEDDDEDGYHYSDDHENYSDDSKDDVAQQQEDSDGHSNRSSILQSSHSQNSEKNM